MGDEQANYLGMIDQIGIGRLRVDANGMIVEINLAVARMLGYTMAELVGRNFRNLAHPEDWKAELIQMGGAGVGSGSRATVKRCRNAEGGWLWLETTCSQLLDRAGIIRGYALLFREMPEHKPEEARQQVPQSQANLFRQALRLASSAILIAARDGRVVYANEAFTELTGYRIEEILNQTPRFLRSGHQDQQFYVRLWETILAGEIWWGEVVNRRKNGNLYSEEQTITPVCDVAGEVTHFVATKQEITLRKRMETELRHSRERFQKIFRANPVAIGICTQNGNRFLDANDSYLALVGYTRDEIMGRSASELGLWAQPANRQALVEALRERGSVCNFEIKLRAKSGKQVDVLTSIQPMQIGLEPCWLFIDMDITERKNLEEQVRQAAKLESIGTLAGGVAHDFNNLLTVIQGQSELLTMEPGLSPAAHDFADQIRMATDRAAKLTRQLLTFGRKQPIQPKPLDLNDALGQLNKMLQRIIGEDICLEVLGSADLPLVLADVGMIEQVVFNLAVNARDAMPQGGTLVIRTDAVHISPADAKGLRRSGNFVCLTVQDTGHGIAPEILERIFEPFFTTKAVGKGTGLGLATAHSIVEQHKGWMEVESQLGYGTTFRSYLPALGHPVGEAAGRTTAGPAMASQVQGGRETILVVEDERVVRVLARDVLKQFGYEIWEAVSGVDALEKWGGKAAEIDLLLTDLVMPGGLDGFALARRFRALNPAMKVVFSSGYARPMENQEELKMLSQDAFLQKPYTPKQLGQIVRETLDT